MKIIITDLTRFKNPELVCTAGVASDGTVVRPMPYLKSERCQELNIHPGGILEGDFSFQGSARPHIEDATFENLVFTSACSKAEFRAALEATLYDSISAGFGVAVRDKCIPNNTPPVRSLITIDADPSSFSITQDRFDRTKLKAHFSDRSGLSLSYVSVTDRGFYDFAQEHTGADTAAELTEFIRSQEKLFLRIGLSRCFQANDGRNGYWIQVNGIYTFPNYLRGSDKTPLSYGMKFAPGSICMDSSLRRMDHGESTNAGGVL